MSNGDTQIGRDYLRWVMNRGPQSTDHPLSRPAGFLVDWHDQPSRYKIYEDVTRLALPYQFPAQLAPVAALGTDAAPESAAPALTMTQVSTLLLLTNGLLKRQ